jgi:hypothetical protein
MPNIMRIMAKRNKIAMLKPHKILVNIVQVARMKCARTEAVRPTKLQAECKPLTSIDVYPTTLSLM